MSNPSQSPFIAPPPNITLYNGNPVPRPEWAHFSLYSDALNMLNIIQNAPLISYGCIPPLSTPLKIQSAVLSIVDGIVARLDMLFANNAPYDPRQPIPKDYTSTWWIIGVVYVDGIPFVVNEYVGDLVLAQKYPRGSVDTDANGIGGGPLSLLLMMDSSAITGVANGTAEATFRPQ